MPYENHRSTGMDYYYFILRTILGMLIFFIWSNSINLFDGMGWSLFYDLFVIMFISGLIARAFAYLFLYFPSKRVKGIIPTFWEFTFQSKINRLSLVFIVGLAICCVIYAFGIDQYIIDFYFVEKTEWTPLIGYLFIKLGAQAIAWAFLKTR
ncbi:MAG: hypothetical protein ACTSQJ_15165 [Promethearchaeota archaeon]